MAITAAMVKELREMTGAGMMDCKKALNETDGNMDAAIEYLRKNGQAKADKKAGGAGVPAGHHEGGQCVFSETQNAGRLSGAYAGAGRKAQSRYGAVMALGQKQAIPRLSAFQQQRQHPPCAPAH